MSTGMTPDERKLAPIYEDISAGRYKAAESAVTRHLKKNPKSHTALTLKFVLNERQGAPEATYLKSLKDARQGAMNPRSLWWITNSLRSLKRLDLCLEIHQDMWAQYPDSIEVGEQVFLCAAAVWDTKVMAESSRKMFNGVKDEIWARLAAWAEWANKAPQPTPSQPYPPPAPEGSLKIASILLSTAGPSINTSDILWLKSQILLSSGEYKKCHELLVQNGQGGSLARDWYRMKGIEEISKRVEDDTNWVWEEELGEFLDYWSEDDLAYRNYAYYQHSNTASKALLATRPHLVKGFISKLDELHAQHGTKERAPLLAKLELDLNLSNTDLALPEDEWKKLVMEYWTKWGAKGSIVPELEAVAGSRTAWIQEMMDTRIAEGQTDEKSYRQVVNANLYVLRQKPTDWKPSDEEIKGYWQLYLDGLTYGQNLPHTDIQPADEIGLATVQLILSTQNPTAPLRAILALEYILSKSPSCAHAKFLLIRLYRSIGAISLVKPVLEDLKLSEVQLDTLLHIWIEGAATDAILAPIPRGQELSAWENCTAAMEKMYNRSATDLPEYMKQAIEHGSFSKIHSIRSLASTLVNSQTQAAFSIEQTRYRLLKGDPVPRALSGLTTLKSGEMVDSRNWELMPSIGGLRTPVNDLTRLTDGGAEVLEKQAAVLRSLGGEDANEGPSAGMSASDEAFYGAMTRLSRRMTSSEQPLSGLFDDLLKVSESSRWSILHHGVHIIELATILDLKSREIGQANKSKSKDQKALMQELKEVRDSLKSQIKPLIGKLNGLIMDDREIDWRGINGDLIDPDFVSSVGQKVMRSRVESLEKLKSLLESL